MMKSLFFLFFAALIYGCSDAKGQQTNQAFSVHAEIMPPETPEPTAKNVKVGSQSVSACFQNCDLQITLNYCGQALIERYGKSPEVFAAKVFQIEQGAFLAEIEGGQYVKVYSKTGVVQMDIAGEFSVHVP